MVRGGARIVAERSDEGYRDSAHGRARPRTSGGLMSVRGSGTGQKRAGSGKPSPSIDVPPGDGAAAAGSADASDPELLKTILDLTPARIAYYDRENRCRFFSPAFGRVVGASPEQTVGRTPDETGISAAPRERPSPVHREAVRAQRADRDRGEGPRGAAGPIAGRASLPTPGRGGSPRRYGRQGRPRGPGPPLCFTTVCRPRLRHA